MEAAPCSIYVSSLIKRSMTCDLLRDDVPKCDDHFLWPYVNGNRGGVCEQGYLVGMYVSYFNRWLKRLLISLNS